MMGRKALAGAKIAKEKGEAAVEGLVGKDGVGTGYLGNAVSEIKKNKKKREAALKEAMKD